MLMGEEYQVNCAHLFDSPIMLNDEFPNMTSAPVSGSLPSSSLFFYMEDVDPVYKRAVAAGCRVVMPLDNMFWGDRFGKVEDPFGHQWSLATHVEDVAPEEMKRQSIGDQARQPLAVARRLA